MSMAPHLDDDALSAHLDGFDVGTDGVDHLAACAECRARLDSLASAAAAVGAAPPLPPAAVMDAAVRHALDAEARGARRPVLVALAAAAVVVLGVVGVTVLNDGDRANRDSAALSDTAADDGAAGESGGGSVAADGGHLGELDDTAALSARVRSVVEPPPVADQSGGGGSGAGAVTSGEAVVAPAARAMKDGDRDESDEDPYCRQAVADEYDTGLGALVYRATLRWEGTDAVAVAYLLAEPKGELDHRLFVLARDSCQLLVAQTF